MDWDHPVQAAKPQVVMLNGYQTQHETTMTLYCHDQAMKKVTVIGEKDKKLFHVEGAAFGTSWSWRRKVFDSVTEKHLFDFRHESISLKNPWLIEDKDGRKLCSIVHNTQLTYEHSAVNATIRTQAGEDVVVAMRQKDHAATTAHIQVGNSTVAVIYKIEDNDLSPLPKDRYRSVWKARIAPETDLSMVTQRPALSVLFVRVLT
ncbi:hypothetical protein F5883DRAFT_539616 [Diaporthe sp. PMI_573]|nr:hypothetical protein F5883DRAFT_539616 [Diaporthaceae sp. PMI_573]